MGRKTKQLKRHAANVADDTHQIIIDLAKAFDVPMQVVADAALVEFDRFTHTEKGEAIAERQAAMVRARIGNVESRSETGSPASPVR